MGDHATARDRFEPLRPAGRAKLWAAAVLGILAWLVAWLIALWLFHATNAIELGLLLSCGSIVVATPVLVLLRWGRRRQERRFERDRAHA